MSGFWTETRTTLLREHWGLGWSARESAEQLGCTKNAVIGKRHRLSLFKEGRKIHPCTAPLTSWPRSRPEPRERHG